MICDRCHKEALGFTVSKFNTDDICMACDTDERDAPGYEHARAIEEAACREGNFNFPGIGLSAEDRLFLQARRLARAANAKLARV